MKRPIPTLTELWEAKLYADRRKEARARLWCLILIPILAITGVLCLFTPQ